MKTSRSERPLDRTRTFGLHTAVVAVLCAVIPRPATAQTAAPAADEPTTDPKLAEARTAFKEGTALARQAQWGEALLAFERSASLRPHTFTTYNIGYCERALGRYTRARKLLAKALAENDARGGTALSADVVADARKYLAEMDKRVARATVTLAPADAAVAVDGRPLEVVAGDRTPPVLSAGTRELGAGDVPPSASFELLVDPGSHVFTVSRAGSNDLVVSRTFAAGTVTQLELKLVVRAAPPEDHAALSVQVPSPRESKTSKLPGYLLLGLGAAGLATGTVTGILAIQSKHKLDQSCGSEKTSCPQNLQSEHDKMNLRADVSTIAFSVGAVAVGLSTVLLLSSGSKASTGGSAGSSTTAGATGTSGLVIHPAIGYGSAFLTGSF